MQAEHLFDQNFAVSESLIQLYEMFQGLTRPQLSQQLRLAICTEWQAPENLHVEYMVNEKVSVIARAVARVPQSLTYDGGLDFLLRQAVIVASTSVESFYWDVLRENVLTVVRARRTNADDSIKNLKLTVGDYISAQEYEDPDLRIKQVILKNFERGTLYTHQSIDDIAKILTVRTFWNDIEPICGEKSEILKKHIGDLITRRNQIAHRADRPVDGEEADAHGLRPIQLAWTNMRIQSAKTLVKASVAVFKKAIERLEQDIETSREHELAKRAASRK